MPKATPITLSEEFNKLTFLSNRTPQMPEDEQNDAFGMLSEYRNGGVFIAHYAGNSEWERHPQGDEIVQVLEGETTLILLEDGVEKRNLLGAGQLLVVPQNVWHRFETPKGLKALVVTPQPTEHQLEFPGSD